ncbi:MAG: dihydrodipicolinate synthase family protein [Desulfobacteraceae bacterium]|nr:dihydrodipicolinate synthase family protein [Desulfobacteraceae bacterium]
MSMKKIAGIIPPIPTPFVNGKLAPEKLADNIEKWCRTGISGILVLGSNGEYVYLSEAEKREVVSVAVETMPADKILMVGSGCESTAETIRSTNDYARLGAQAALVVTPSYYAGRMTPEALEAHYTAVADAADLPILLYNVPKFTGININSETAGRLASHDNIVGIKDSSGNVAQLGEILNRTGREFFSVLVGTAGALYPALTMGSAGGVLALSNIAPGECIEIQAMTDQGRHEDAKQLYLRMLPVNTAVTATYGIPGLKAALDMLGYYGGDPRLPLQPLNETGKQEVAGILDSAGLL